MRAMNFKGEYVFDTTQAEGQFRKPASNEKLMSLIGEFQFTPFDEGACSPVALVSGGSIPFVRSA